jgi:hypothetical protein
MKFILSICLLIVFSRCGTEKEILTNNDTSTMENTAYKMDATFGQPIDFVGDNYTIKSAKIEQNSLFLVVNILGECKPHDFKMVSSAGPSNSIQPVRNVVLIHLSNGDNCTRPVDVSLEINITELAIKKEKGFKTILKLKGWKDNLDYVFYVTE